VKQVDHKSLIASLSTEQRTVLTEKSDRQGLTRLCLHWGLIAVLAALVAFGLPGWQLLLLPLGVLIVFLFTLLHEAIHRTPFSTGWINDVVARISGFLLLLPADWFRYFHFAHHRYTQDPENDPELASSKPATPWQYAIHVSGLPIWRSAIQTLVRNAAGGGLYPYVPEKGRNRVRREAQAMLIAYLALVVLSLVLQNCVLLWIWIIPALMGQPFLRLYLLAEHGRCPYVANMLENSRTTFTNALVRMLAWNMPYHAEHHSYPSVPFYRLPEFHRLIQKHLAVTEHGYGRFNAKYYSTMKQAPALAKQEQQVFRQRAPL
jgi:fatty acid desaturase